jgi:hypothetical protein
MKEHIFRKTCLAVLLYMVAFLWPLTTGALAGVPSSVFQYVLSYNNHVYAITINQMSWTAADILAGQHGGHLVTVNDAAENQFLSDNYPTFGSFSEPWIGLNDNSGTWAWAYGWADYTNWSDGEPSGGTEHCVMTNWGAPGEWNDGTCEDPRAAIVEWKSVPGTVNLPQTGQTACYSAGGGAIPCAGTGQDGNINSGVPWPEPRFSTSIGADCRMDNLTGLIWAKNGSLSVATTWQGALDFVAGLTLCGLTGWRLPNINELQSLTYPCGDIDISTWLTDQGFTGMQSLYWSSTTGAYNTGYAADVSMSENVMITHAIKSENHYVLPVRGFNTGPARVPRTGQTASYDANNPQRDDGALHSGVIWPDPRFTPSDECIVDNLTGLIWTKNGNLGGGLITWQEALDYANSRNEVGLCGRRDWRLPNLYEIKSLMNRGETSTAAWLNSQGFNNVQSSSYYWTSSNYMANAWKLYLGGTSIFDVKSNDGRVWPVSGRICYDNLARRSDTDPLNYATIQEAYDANSGDHELMARASSYCEDIYFDADADILLKGGYDEGFGAQTGYTTIYGSVTIMGGSVRAENIVIL